MNPRMTALVARQYPELIVGVKIAHYFGQTWEPIDRQVQAGEMADLPVMVDFGRTEPALSLETLFLENLRPGDIFTHMYAEHIPNIHGAREAVVDKDGQIKNYMLQKREKGILFDVGHCSGGFFGSRRFPQWSRVFGLMFLALTYIDRV